MTKNEKSIITVFCLVLLLLAGFILVRYYHRVSDYLDVSAIPGVAEDLIPISGYTYTTTCDELTGNEYPDGTSSRRTFTHEVYTPESHELAVITVTVTGNNSTDSFIVSHISTSLSDVQQDGLTVSEHISGDTATIVLYLNQISVCHFQYRLSADGSIDCL